MNSRIITVTDESFEEMVFQSEKPTVVDFWAPWCGPCLAMSPTFEELSNEYEQVRFAKVNVDEANKIVASLGIRGIPTFLMFSGGRIIHQVMGATTKENLSKEIERFLEAA